MDFAKLSGLAGECLVARVPAGEQGNQGNLDLLESTDKFQEDPHAVAAGKEAGHDSSLATHRAFDDIHGLAGLDAGFDRQGLFFIKLGPEIADQLIRHGGSVVHERHRRRNEGGGKDVAEGFLDGIPAKEVAGKHGFDEPDPATGGFFLVPDAGGKSFEACSAQVLGGEMFAFGPGTQAPPPKIIGRLRHGIVLGGRHIN